MMKYTIFGETYRTKVDLPLKGKFEAADFVRIDLSVSNLAFSPKIEKGVDLLEKYIFGYLEESKAKCAYGGYAEKRRIYERSDHFAEQQTYRNIHLGIDFWMQADTVVVAPLPGKVHSFQNNNNPGDYGPTVILEHGVGNVSIHSLYGHLSAKSLERLKVGQLIERGQRIGTLGKFEENRDWPPHLHFQLIRDMEGRKGDYPGVCFETETQHYLTNCPDPVLFFGGPWKKFLI